MPIAEVVAWTTRTEGSRLFLPPIQRSAVWRNVQIINYWDSLLRGYPAGLMMVHHPKEGAHQARNAEGDDCEIRPNDFQLFDGQQRLTAILLGLENGQLHKRLKLWVDLGVEPSRDSGLRFALRISSTGQPFGYQAEAPNEKFELGRRRSHAQAWAENQQRKQEQLQHGDGPADGGSARLYPEAAFAEVEGRDLVGAVCVLPLHAVIHAVQHATQEPGCSAVEVIQACCPLAPADRVEKLVQAVERALRLPILFQLIDPEVIKDEQEYIRFFGRLGQGGTPLSNDELTYSIIKHHFPEVHGCMRKITEGKAGRMGSAVNLVLAALRVAKARAPWETKQGRDWEIYVRPYPAFVTQLKTELEGVRKEFLGLMGAGPCLAGTRLQDVLESLRQRLTYDETTNPGGLPVIMLARLPHALMDVLILMERARADQAPAQTPTPGTPDPLPAFALYWLLFVEDPEKAANEIFKRFYLKDADWQPAPGAGAEQRLIRNFESRNISHCLPGKALLDRALDEITAGTEVLRSWDERFAALNVSQQHPMGQTLRVLAGNRGSCCNALLWLQRQYLTERFPDYDPTSNRDEDLPIDLDHLVPSAKFRFDWRSLGSRLSFHDTAENYRARRDLVGNSLGNFRWLDASDNRSRQDGAIAEQDETRDTIADVPQWNELILGQAAWTRDHVADFQKRIDRRTVAIYQALLEHGGLEAFATDHEPAPEPAEG